MSLGTFTPNLTPTQQRAQRAVAQFNKMSPQLSAFARLLTGRPKVRVVGRAGTPCTDGDTIYMRPPIEMGELRRHTDPRLCNKRDWFDILQCEACRAHEDVLITLYHEIAHITFASFQPVADEDKADIIVHAVKEAGAQGDGTRAAKIAKIITERNPKSYVEANHYISRFLPVIFNAIEDARVNVATYRAWPGTRKMFRGQNIRIFERGIQNEDGEYSAWRDAPRNAQIIIGLYCKAMKQDYTGWFEGEVEEALNDEHLTRMLDRVEHFQSARDVYSLGFPVLERIRELGFCKAPDDVEDDPEPEPEPEPQPADPDNEDTGGDDDEVGPESEQEEDSDAGGAEPEPEPEQGSDTGDAEPEPSGADTEPEPAEQDTEPEQGSDAGDADTEPEPEQGDSTSGSDEEDVEADEQPPGGGTPEPCDAGDETGGDTDEGADGNGDEDGGDGAGTEPDEDDGDSGSGDADGEADDEGADAGGSGQGGDADDESTHGDTDAEDGDEWDDEAGSEPGGSGGDPDAEAAPQGEETDYDDGAEAQGTGPGSGSDNSAPSGPEFPDDGAEVYDDDDDEDDGWPGDQRGEQTTEVVSEGDGSYDEEDLERDGTPEDVERVLKEFGDHGKDGVPSHTHGDDEEHGETDTGFEGGRGGAGDSGGDDGMDMEAVMEIDRALRQAEFFDAPSENIAGVRIHRFEKPIFTSEGRDLTQGLGYSGITYRNAHMYGSDLADLDERLFAPSLLRLRRVFMENKRGAVHRNKRSGRIDRGVLARRVATEDDRLFLRRTKPGKRDYFVVIGFDISGSTAGVMPGQYSTTREHVQSVIALIKQAAYAQAELCDRLGVPFVVYAHTAHYSDTFSRGDHYTPDMMLDMFEIKRLDEPWSASAKKRLLDLTPASGNLDGHTMEFYRKLCDRSGASEKIIMYYTDGAMPASNYQEELAILQNEIEICKKRNYHIVGVGAMTDSPTQHGLETVQLDSMQDLPKVVKRLEEKLRD